MKQLISIMTAVAAFICLSTAPAQADRKTREGFLLGVGAAVLGTVIYQGLNQPSGHKVRHRHPGPPAYERRSQCRNTRWHAQQPAGRWEIERIWVEPVYDTRWNQGHHKRKGKWNKDRHEKFRARDGYWKEIRVWVRY
ncbi:MAG: hypothetical protein V2J08_15155 [Desulfotignum sp.]|nr:hypothetical protein [Desulfotignum sp.]